MPSPSNASLAAVGGEAWWRAQPEDVRAAAPARASRLSFAALTVYSVILVAAPQEFVGALRPVRIALIVGLVALAAHAIDRLMGRMRAPAWPVEVPLLAALLGWALLMVPLSYHPGGSVAMITGLFLKSLAVFLLLASVVDSSRRLNTIVLVLMGCGAIIAATAIRHYLQGTLTTGTADRIAGYGGSSMAGNPNDLALLLNIVIPIATMWCIGARRGGRILGAAVVALLAAGVIVTFSRAGFLTLALSGLLLLWRFARRGFVLPLAAGLAGILLFVVLMPAGFMARLSTISNVDADRTGSAQDRWRDTVAATKYALQHPLIGAGAGLDYLALNDVRGKTWLSVHNAYLNYAVDLGVIGLGLFLTVYASAYAGVARVERRRLAHDPEDRLGMLASGVRVSLAAFGLAAFFHPVAYHGFFYYLAGLAVAVRRIDAQPEERL